MSSLSGPGWATRGEAALAREEERARESQARNADVPPSAVSALRCWSTPNGVITRERHSHPHTWGAATWSESHGAFMSRVDMNAFLTQPHQERRPPPNNTHTQLNTTPATTHGDMKSTTTNTTVKITAKSDEGRRVHPVDEKRRGANVRETGRDSIITTTTHTTTSNPAQTDNDHKRRHQEIITGKNAGHTKRKWRRRGGQGRRRPDMKHLSGNHQIYAGNYEGFV